MTNNSGKIIILSGPSGVGKGSVNKVLVQDKNLKLEYSVSMTTRAPREGEVDGVNYFFVSREQFEKNIAEDKFIEYAEFIGNYYGTPRDYVYKKISEGKNVILEVEVTGATQVLENEDKDKLVSIFLMPPNLKMLEIRLNKRGTEDWTIVKKRLDKALLEIPLKKKYDYVIINDNIETAVSKIRDVLIREGTLDIPPESSFYYILETTVKKLIAEKYMFFVEHWRENVIKLESPENQTITFFYTKLVKILSNRIYHFVLKTQPIAFLDNAAYIAEMAEYFMLDFNFFSLIQEDIKF